MSTVNGKSLLASINNGQLASQIAKTVSMQEVTEAFRPCQEPLSDEESSDEETYFAALRHQAKVISQKAVAHGCLPACARPQPPRPSPFASLLVLQESIEVLQEIMSKPSNLPAVARRATEAECREAEARVANAFAEADAREAELEAANVSRVLNPTSALLVPIESPASKSTSCESVPSCAPQLPSKPPKPTTFRRHANPYQVAKCPLFFCMDATEDEPTCASACDSSLARGYDALGAEHQTLDDDSDAELCVAEGRESSITRCYEALGTAFGKSPSRPASRSGQLPPVRPRSRGAFDTPKSLCRAPNPALPSAMQLDLGIACDVPLHQQADSGHVWTPSLPAKTLQPRPRSLNSPRVTKATFRLVPKVVLPQLPAANGVGDIPYSSKSGFKMKAESCGKVWDTPLHGSARQFDRRQIVF